MPGILKNRHGMTILGQGGKIILFALPALAAAGILHIYFPTVAALPDGLRFLTPLGYALLVPGLALWLTALAQLLYQFPKGNLVTSGAYGIVRNPIYSSVGLFILPAVSLLTHTWVYLLVSAFLVAGVQRFIGPEEQMLARVFGAEYAAYCARVDRMLPFKKP